MKDLHPNFKHLKPLIKHSQWFRGSGFKRAQNKLVPFRLPLRKNATLSTRQYLANEERSHVKQMHSTYVRPCRAKHLSGTESWL